MRQSIKTADADKESWIMEKSERERDIEDLKVLCLNSLILLLDASSHLYKSVCPSVRPSVGRSVGPSVMRFFKLKK